LEIYFIFKIFLNIKDYSLVCCLYELQGDWNGDNLTYMNRPIYNILPKKTFLIPPLNEDDDFYLDVTDVDMEHGFFISPIGEYVPRSFYSKEGAHDLGYPNHIPALIVRNE